MKKIDEASLRYNLALRHDLVLEYHGLQMRMKEILASLRQLKYVGRFRPQVQITVCPDCQMPFGAREMRAHRARCKGRS